MLRRCGVFVSSAWKRVVSSDSLPNLLAMTESESKEVEKVLLHLSDARMRTKRAADALAKDRAAEHVVESLRSTEQGLAEMHRALSQATYYAVPAESLRLAV
jgi:hypothetical protein